MSNKIDAASIAALKKLDQHLRHQVWGLGKNAVLAWTPKPYGLDLLYRPVCDLLVLATQNRHLLVGPRYRTESKFREIAELTGQTPIPVQINPSDTRASAVREREPVLRIGPGRGEVPWTAVEGFIRRYSIYETPHRAVLLFDIVGFSKLTSVQQVAQLNALEHAISLADATLRATGADVEFARTTTGDGFYVWNRRLGIMADQYLLALAILALGVVGVAVSCDDPNRPLVPQLRTGFSIGSHFSYHQIEGLAPRGSENVVGEVTIVLARLMAEAASGQIMIGEFLRPIRDDDGEGGDCLSTAQFVKSAHKVFTLVENRLAVDHQKLGQVQLWLGDRDGRGDGRLTVTDKHGRRHVAYNACAKIQTASNVRGGISSIFLGYDPTLT